MPNYYQTVQEFARKRMKKMGMSGGEGDTIPTQPIPQNPISGLGIEPLFRRRTLSDKGGLTKYLFEFDVATHTIVICLIVIVALVSIVRPGLLPKLLSILSPEKNAASVMVVDSSFQNPITKPVYASGAELSAAKIFSVDPTNVTLVLPGTPKRDVYGFFPHWMLEREKDIPFDQLTAISLFGLDVDGGGNIITENEGGSPNPGWEMWNDSKLTNVINRARRQRLSIEVTVKNFDNANIVQLVSSDESHKRFIANAIYLVQSKSLNGVNIDFEYVGTPDRSVRDGFTRLITNLRSEMRRQIPNATLSVDTYANAASIQGLFDLERLSEQVDSIIVMGYDIHTPSGSPGPIAPLDGQMSILGFIQSYLEKIGPEKIILAVPYYGYDWSRGEGKHDMLSYAEIVGTSSDKTIRWDENAKSPYYTYTTPGVGEERVVHFENVRSLGLKYDFINAKGLKGVGIWALGYDGQNTDLRNLLVEKFAK